MKKSKTDAWAVREGVACLGRPARGWPQLARAVRRMFALGARGVAFAWLLDARVIHRGLGRLEQLMLDRQLRRLVRYDTLPCALVVRAELLEWGRGLACALARMGGVLGVFTQEDRALSWAHGQAMVFCREANWRTEGIARTLHKPVPGPLGQ